MTILTVRSRSRSALASQAGARRGLFGVGPTLRAGAGCGRRSVLVTGFAPFPKHPINASASVAPAVALLVQAAFPDVSVSSAVVATEWQRGPDMLADLILAKTPNVLISFGIASRARGFEIETRALNTCSDAPDAAGVCADTTRLDDTAPEQLAARLPVGDVLRRLRARGYPVRPSRHAGLYLCNAVLFTGLNLARYLPDLARVGFVHLPAELPVPGHYLNEVNRSSPLSFEDAVIGGAEVVAACLGRPLPRHVLHAVGAARRRAALGHGVSLRSDPRVAPLA